MDGFRTFLVYDPPKVAREGETVYELDPERGEKIGLVDMEGGWEGDRPEDAFVYPCTSAGKHIPE